MCVCLGINPINSSWPRTIAQWLASMGCIAGYDVFNDGKREQTSKVAGDGKPSIMRDCGIPGMCTGLHVHGSTVLQIANVFLTCSKSVAVPF